MANGKITLKLIGSAQDEEKRASNPMSDAPYGSMWRYEIIVGPSDLELGASYAKLEFGHWTLRSQYFGHHGEIVKEDVGIFEETDRDSAGKSLLSKATEIGEFFRANLGLEVNLK